MKKQNLFLVLLIAVLFIIPVFTVIEANKNLDFSELKTDDNWEFVKNRVSQGYVALNITRFSGPILYELHNATEHDSMAMKEIVQELKMILPNKTIESYSSFKESQEIKLNIADSMSTYNLDDQVIRLYFSAITVPGEIKSHGYENGNIIELSEDSSRFNGGFINPKISFLLRTNLPFAKRKKYIQNAFIRKLTQVSTSNNSTTLSIENEELNKSIFASREFDPINSEFTSYDKFFLQKLYSKNFPKDLETYIYKTYPWRYATHLFDNNKGRFVGTLVSISFGVIIIFVAIALLYRKQYKYTFLKYLLPMLLIYLSYNCISNLYFYFLVYHVSNSITDYLAYFFLSMIVFSFLALLLFLLDKCFIRKNMSFVLELILKIGFVILVGVLFIYGLTIFQINDGWSISIYSYEDYIKTIILVAIGRGVLIYLNHFSQNLIKEKDLELSQLKEVNAQAEIRLLQSQINPHFLYNALNSIASLAHKNADKTEKMALSLSDLFKYTINRKGKKDSTIGDEVEMVTNYLEVEQIRFDDRLHFTIEVDKTLENTKIPMFLIQPLIENAVKHGISKVEEKGQITLCIQRDNGGFLIIVEDNGPDFPEGLVSGHGLQTVFDLLRLSYGDKASINWKNTPTKHIKISIDH